MATRSEVEQFLKQFKVKLEIWGIFFLDNREKNKETMTFLNFRNIDRLNVVKSIEVEDYSQGPIRDELNVFGEMWVFGKDVAGQEIYIKITLGRPSSTTICISFHIAEHAMLYPFKNIKED